MTARYSLHLACALAFGLFMAATAFAQQREASILSAASYDGVVERSGDGEIVLRHHNPGVDDQVVWVNDSAGCPGGYLFGTNCWEDQAKAVAFDMPAGLDEIEILRVNAHLFRQDSPTLSAYDVTIYSGTTSTGPDLAVAMQEFSMDDIEFEDPTGPGPWPLTSHVFDDPVMMDEPFFVSFEWFGRNYDLEDFGVVATDFQGAANAIVWEYWTSWSTASSNWTGNTDGWFLWVEAVVRDAAISTEGGATAQEITLSSVYPNPLATGSHVDLTLAAPQHVKVEVFNLLGQRVATVFDGMAPADRSVLPIDGSNLTAGVYVVRVAGEDFSQSRKFVVAR